MNTTYEGIIIDEKGHFILRDHILYDPKLTEEEIEKEKQDSLSRKKRFKFLDEIDLVSKLIRPNHIPIRPNKQVYIFTDSDLDGTSSRIIFEYFFDKMEGKPEFIFQTKINDINEEFEKKYKQPLETLIKNSDKNSTFVFADLAPNSYTLELIQKYANILIFDHHETTRRLLGEFEGYFYSENECGTALVYKYLLPIIKERHWTFENKCLEEFVNLVNTYDLFLDDSPKFPDAFNLHNVLFSMVRRNQYTGYTDFVNKQKKKFDVFPSFHWLPGELEIIENERKAFEEDLRLSEKDLKLREDNQGNKYGYFKHYRRLSMLCRHFLNKHQLSYVVARNTYYKDEFKMSLRSLGFPINGIAEKYGGGGHQKASGFEFDNELDYQLFDSGSVHLI